MNKWLLFIMSVIISVLSTYAALVMVQHYYVSIEYKFERWDNVAAIAIAEIISSVTIFIVHFILHVMICLFLIYKSRSKRIPFHILVRLADSWKINFVRIALIFIIVTFMALLIPYSFPAWSILVTILMLVVYSFWILLFVYHFNRLV